MYTFKILGSREQNTTHFSYSDLEVELKNISEKK